MFDPFAGSNTTGEICEAEGRNWIAFELDKEYLETSRYRFEPRPADTPAPATNGKTHAAHSQARQAEEPSVLREWASGIVSVIENGPFHGSRRVPTKGF